MNETPLDAAHARMIKDTDDDAARLGFYERLADGEFFLLLNSEAKADNIDPEVFDIPEGRFVLVFDREHRLADFTSRVAPFAALSGRSIAKILAGKGIGLGVNLDVAPSSILIPSDAVDWLCEVLAYRPDEVTETPQEIFSPAALPERFVTALDTKLATATGLAKMAYLIGVRWQDGRNSHLLCFVDAMPGSERSLASAAGEALIFSGLDAGEVDVSFFLASDTITERLAKVGLRFDLPAAPEPAVSLAPGTDPSKPPKLR